MSLNKFMHPRNRYRKPPDFKALAIKYPEFRKFAKQDISGKVSLNFKDVEALRALTRTLLLEDFSLDVEIPLSRLIPTLPLRLNYLLWIEDLLESNNRTSDVKGIDIGCGASCIYPLLAAKQFGWRMLATEVDMESAFIAGRNVKKNNLLDMVKVRSANEGQMLEGLLEANTVYDFCMCNPPFFSSTEELDPKNVSRNPNRPAPRNAHSGTATELVAPGGETAFIAEIIRDSTRLKATVRIYTVMVGHKTSVEKVRTLLQEAGVASASITSSEFCQGRTTRWGVAWTLDPAISFPDVSQLKKKKPVPLCHTFQADVVPTMERLKTLLEQLQITYKMLKTNKDLCAMEITAAENTWTSSRKKRRQEMLKQNLVDSNKASSGDAAEVNVKTNGEVEKTEIDGSAGNAIKTSCQQEGMTEESGGSMTENGGNDQEKVAEKCEAIVTQDEKIEQGKVVEKSGPDIGKAEENYSEKNFGNGNKRSLPDEDESSGSCDLNPAKKPKMEGSVSSSNVEDKSKKEPVFHGSLLLRKNPEGCSVELTWLRGSGGKESVHQVLQYLKNNFKPH